MRCDDGSASFLYEGAEKGEKRIGYMPEVRTADLLESREDVRLCNAERS